MNKNTYNLKRFKNSPTSFIAVGLKLIGFTLLWQKAEIILKLPFRISLYLLYFSLSVTVLIIVFYIAKIIRYPDDVKKLQYLYIQYF